MGFISFTLFNPLDLDLICASFDTEEELGKQSPISEKDDSPSGVIVTKVELILVYSVFSFPSGIMMFTFVIPWMIDGDKKESEFAVFPLLLVVWFAKVNNFSFSYWLLTFNIC